MIKTPFEVMNDKADAKRPVTYGDFAILSSTKSNNDKIESIFAAYGIPVNVQRRNHTLNVQRLRRWFLY